jgi:cyanuric acid amidohydrolase
MSVPLVGVHVCPMDRPSDLSALCRLLDDGTIDARDVVAVVGKTEGTGLGKDVGRETVDAAVKGELAARLGVTPQEVGDRVCMILSGGSPGVLTPHVTLFTRRWVDAPVRSGGVPGRLTIGRATSVDILPEEIGRKAQVDKVAAAVRDALADAGLASPADAHAVMVKGPALTEEGIVAARSRGVEPVTLDLSVGPEGAMCFSNDASALGVAVATGEVSAEAVTDEVIRRDFDLYSDVAITSSAGEKTHAEVLVLGNSLDAAGDLRIGHRAMRDVVDLEAVPDALRSAGLQATLPLQAAQRDRVVYLLAKMVIPGSDRLAGQRITLHDDPVGYHVAKAMGGYLLASTTGQTAAFVSGGERNSHQGPPEGNPLAAIVRVG